MINQNNNVIKCKYYLKIVFKYKINYIKMLEILQ